MYQPIKINLDQEILGGHLGSIPVGPIISVSQDDDVIKGIAVIWNEEFSHVSEYLKANSEKIGTSWEILYKNSYIEDGIEYLKDCIFAANTVVANPSYSNQTLLRCIAEDLSKKQKSEVIDLEETRKEIEALQNQLLAMYEMLDQKYYTTFAIEEAEAAKTETLDSFSSRLTDLITKLDERAKDAGLLAEEAQAELSTAKAELATVVKEVEVFRAEKAQAEKDKVTAERKSKLSDIGFSLEDETKLAFYLELNAETFDTVVADLASIKGAGNNKTNAEKKDRVTPEPYGRTDDIDIKSAHNEVIKQEKRG